MTDRLTAKQAKKNADKCNCPDIDQVLELIAENSDLGEYDAYIQFTYTKPYKTLVKELEELGYTVKLELDPQHGNQMIISWKEIDND